jgi:hypothetical protein
MIRRPVAATAAGRCSTPNRARRSRCSTTIPLTRGIGQDLPQPGAVAGHTRPDPGHRRIQREPAVTGFLVDPSGLASHVITPLSGRHTDSKHSSPAGLGGWFDHDRAGRELASRHRQGSGMEPVQGGPVPNPLTPRPHGQLHRVILSQNNILFHIWADSSPPCHDVAVLTKSATLHPGLRAAGSCPRMSCRHDRAGLPLVNVPAGV